MAKNDAPRAQKKTLGEVFLYYKELLRGVTNFFLWLAIFAGGALQREA
jgi:hypothetical protein